MIGTLVLGDLSTHQASWLRHASVDTVEGRALRDLAAECNFRQLVVEPTRRPHLLDLLLTDMGLVRVGIGAAVTAHFTPCTTVRISVPRSCDIRRTLWQFARADRDKLRETTGGWPSTPDVTTSASADRLQIMLRMVGEDCVPQVAEVLPVTSHPWVDETVVRLVEEENAARGSALAEAASAAGQ